MDGALAGGCACTCALGFALAFVGTARHRGSDAGARTGQGLSEDDGRPGAAPSVAVAEGTAAWVRLLAGKFQAIPAVREFEEGGRRDALRRDCLKELPTLLDVVTLGLSSGLSFDAALELYCDRYQNALARAFGEALLSWRIGAETRSEALSHMADELDVGALRSFAATVSQSLEFGAPLAEALEAQAEAIRDEQRSQMEEEIEKVPVRMLIPLGCLIVPAMLLAILGPLLGSSLTLG